MMMTAEINSYQITPLMATDIECYNAIVNAVTCRNFEIYCQYHKEDFRHIFHKVSKDNKLLSKSYQTLSLIELRECYEYVIEARSKELILEKDIKVKEFSELNEYQQMIVSLVYNYGDKLGGIQGIEGLAPLEVAQWFSWFNSISKFESDILKEKSNENRHPNR